MGFQPNKFKDFTSSGFLTFLLWTLQTSYLDLRKSFLIGQRPLHVPQYVLSFFWGHGISEGCKAMLLLGVAANNCNQSCSRDWGRSITNCLEHETQTLISFLLYKMDILVEPIQEVRFDSSPAPLRVLSAHTNIFIEPQSWCICFNWIGQGRAETWVVKPWTPSPISCAGQPNPCPNGPEFSDRYSDIFLEFV